MYIFFFCIYLNCLILIKEKLNFKFNAIIANFKFNAIITCIQLIFLNAAFLLSLNTSNAVKTSVPIIVEEDSSQEAHETSVSTEIYDGESLEVNTEEPKFIEKPQMEIANRIVWTTPKTVTAETKKATITKETMTATMEVVPSKEDGTTDWDSEVSKYEKDPTLLSTTVDSHEKPGEFTFLDKINKICFQNV